MNLEEAKELERKNLMGINRREGYQKREYDEEFKSVKQSSRHDLFQKTRSDHYTSGGSHMKATREQMVDPKNSIDSGLEENGLDLAHEALGVVTEDMEEDREFIQDGDFKDVARELTEARSRDVLNQTDQELEFEDLTDRDNEGDPVSLITKEKEVAVERKQGARKKLFKPAALAVGGRTKKRMVQALLSPRKKSVLKGGKIQEEKGPSNPSSEPTA
ncbi:hypothetical protein N665_0113s0022 [Sinapis alba]|nr:hypothetical protein N665_0113s0022 [Sinapis alba]